NRKSSRREEGTVPFAGRNKEHSREGTRGRQRSRLHHRARNVVRLSESRRRHALVSDRARARRAGRLRHHAFDAEAGRRRKADRRHAAIRAAARARRGGCRRRRIFHGGSRQSAGCTFGSDDATPPRSCTPDHRRHSRHSRRRAGDLTPMLVRRYVAIVIAAPLVLTFLDRFVLVQLLAERIGIPLLVALLESLAIVGAGFLVRRMRGDIALNFVIGYPISGTLCFLV